MPDFLSDGNFWATAFGLLTGVSYGAYKFGKWLKSLLGVKKVVNVQQKQLDKFEPRITELLTENIGLKRRMEELETIVINNKIKIDHLTTVNDKWEQLYDKSLKLFEASNTELKIQLLSEGSKNDPN